jgi:hypothetical protein
MGVITYNELPLMLVKSEMATVLLTFRYIFGLEENKKCKDFVFCILKYFKNRKQLGDLVFFLMWRFCYT